MSVIIRWLCMAGLVLLIGLGSSGAGARAATLAQVQPQQTLLVAAYPPADEVIKAAIPQWKRLHPNVNIRVLIRDASDHHSVMAASLATASNLPDVMLVEASYLGSLGRYGLLEDLNLPPYNAMALKPRLVAFAFEQGRTPTAEQVAIPIDIGPGTMLYRQDVIQAAGVSMDDMTRSWDSFVAAGVRIKATTGVVLVTDASELGMAIINTTTEAGESRYFDARGRVSVSSPRFVKAFELARDVHRKQLDMDAPAWGGKWREALASGHVAVMFTGAWMAGHLANWLAPQSRGKWRAAALPQQSQGAWGGSFYAIPRRSQDKAMAWEFIQFMALTTQVQLDAFKSHNAFPVLLDAQDDPFFARPIDYLGGQPARLLWRDSSRQIHGTLLHPYDEIARDIVQTELYKVLRDDKDIAQALHDAQEVLERHVQRAARLP